MIFHFVVFISLLTISCSLDIHKKYFPLWSGPRLTRECKRNAKTIFLIILIGLETSTEIFARIPQRVIYGSTPQHLQNIGKQNVVLIFPGAGGPDQNTESLKKQIEITDKKKSIHDRKVYVYNWLKWRGNFIRASFDSQKVGQEVCTDLGQRDISSLHVIGISVGAFAADSCAKAYKATKSNTGKVRLTFLDPFTSKGIFGYGWGNKYFGRSADYVENYINTDDPVPSTSDPLQEAYNFDVTNSKMKKSYAPKEGDSMHSWPGKLLTSNICTFQYININIL
jgi:hypothetical protein